MPPVRPGQRLGPARQRRRQRRATAGQTHVYAVPNHLDEPNIVRWGLTAEQMLFVLIGASIVGVVTIVLLLTGLVIVRPLTGQRAVWWNLCPLVLLVLIRPLAAAAKWRPDGMGPFEYVLLRVTTWRHPAYATWLASEEER